MGGTKPVAISSLVDVSNSPKPRFPAGVMPEDRRIREDPEVLSRDQRFPGLGLIPSFRSLKAVVLICAKTVLSATAAVAGSAACCGNVRND